MCHPTSLEAQPRLRGADRGPASRSVGGPQYPGVVEHRSDANGDGQASRHALSLAPARRLERPIDQVQPGCCPKSITQRAVRTCECGTAHGFAERVETPGRHSSTCRLGSRCCDDGNGVNVALGYSSLFRAHILGHGLGAWLAMVRNLMDDEVATDDVRSSGVGMASGPPSD